MTSHHATQKRSHGGQIFSSDDDTQSESSDDTASTTSSQSSPLRHVTRRRYNQPPTASSSTTPSTPKTKRKKRKVTLNLKNDVYKDSSDEDESKPLPFREDDEEHNQRGTVNYEEIIPSSMKECNGSELDRIDSLPNLKTQFNASDYVGSSILCVDIGSSFSKACFIDIPQKGTPIMHHLNFNLEKGKSQQMPTIIQYNRNSGA